MWTRTKPMRPKPVRAITYFAPRVVRKGSVSRFINRPFGRTGKSVRLAGDGSLVVIEVAEGGARGGPRIAPAGTRRPPAGVRSGAITSGTTVVLLQNRGRVG